MKIHDPVACEHNGWKMQRTFTPKRVGQLAEPLKSFGATFVAMMQTAHLRVREDLACRDPMRVSGGRA
jgi:hypothetical protein